MTNLAQSSSILDEHSNRQIPVFGTSTVVQHEALDNEISQIAVSLSSGTQAASAAAATYNSIDNNQSSIVDGQQQTRGAEIPLQKKKSLLQILPEIQAIFDRSCLPFKSLPYSIILYLLEYHEESVPLTLLRDCVGYFAADPLRTPQLIFRSLYMFYRINTKSIYTMFALRHVRQLRIQDMEHLPRVLSKKHYPRLCTIDFASSGNHDYYSTLVSRSSTWLKSKIRGVSCTAGDGTISYLELSQFPLLRELSLSFDLVSADLIDQINKMPNVTGLSILRPNFNIQTAMVSHRNLLALESLTHVRSVCLEDLSKNWDSQADTCVTLPSCMTELDLDGLVEEMFAPAPSVRKLLLTIDQQGSVAVVCATFPNLSSLYLEYVVDQLLPDFDDFSKLLNLHRLRSLTVAFCGTDVHSQSWRSLCDAINELNARGQLQYLMIRNESDYSLLSNADIRAIGMNSTCALRELHLVGNFDFNLECLSYILTMNGLSVLMIENKNCFAMQWIGLEGNDRLTVLDLVVLGSHTDDCTR